jgi:hypothetical protein
MASVGISSSRLFIAYFLYGPIPFHSRNLQDNFKPLWEGGNPFLHFIYNWSFLWGYMDGYYNIIFACDLCPCQDIILSKTCLFSQLNYMTYHHIVGGGAFATWCAMNHHIASTKYVHFLPTQWPANMIMLTLKCISQITQFQQLKFHCLVSKLGWSYFYKGIEHLFTEHAQCFW